MDRAWFTSNSLLLALVASAVGSAVQGQYWPEVIVPAPAGVTANGHFGTALSLDGDLLLVGAPGSDAGAAGSGCAYLYGRNEGGLDAWNLLKVLSPATPAADAGFGSVVELQGDLAFVGAPQDPYFGYSSGSVSIFQRDLGGPGNWGFKQRLQPNILQSTLAFGTTLHVEADQLLVGCPGYDESPDGQNAVGALVIYRMDSTAIFQQTRFVPGDALVESVFSYPWIGNWFTVVGDQFVHSVGYRAFSLNADSLTDPELPLPVAKPIILTDNFGQAPNSLFFARGTASGGSLLLGVDGPFPPNSCRILVPFSVVPGEGVVQETGFAAPDPSLGHLECWEGRWGEGVAASGQRLVVGAFGDELFTPLGHAEVFDRNLSAPQGFTRLVYLTPPDPGLGDRYGQAVEIDGGVVAVASPYHGPLDQGRVYVYMDPLTTVSEDHRDRSGIVIFPNPVNSTSGHLHLQLEQPSSVGTVLVRNVGGGIVMQCRVNGSSCLPIEGLAAGSYLLSWIPDLERAESTTLKLLVLP